jgi:hypothetical protein
LDTDNAAASSASNSVHHLNSNYAIGRMYLLSAQATGNIGNIPLQNFMQTVSNLWLRSARLKVKCSTPPSIERQLIQKSKTIIRLSAVAFRLTLCPEIFPPESLSLGSFQLL